MNCELRDKSVLYVDGEMDAAAQQAFATHLAGCGECSSAVEQQQALKKAVRVAGKKFSAPPELYATLRNAAAKPQSSAGSWRVWRWAAVCALIVAAFGAGWYLNSRGENATVAELVDQHVTMLASANPMDVISEDRHTVKPWFQGKLPFTFNLPELNNSDFKLLGGRMVYAQHAPGAELIYQVRQHKISIFIFQARDVHGQPSSANHSFTVNGWEQNGLQFYLVTDASGDDAAKLRGLLEAANRA
jgi:anti-sigma factor RsiW